MIIYNVSEYKSFKQNPKDLNMINMYAMHGKMTSTGTQPRQGLNNTILIQELKKSIKNNQIEYDEK